MKTLFQAIRAHKTQHIHGGTAEKEAEKNNKNRIQHIQHNDKETI